MFHNYHSSYYQPKIWEVGANIITCSIQVHQLQVKKIKQIPSPEQQIPQLVQCKSNNYNCNSHNCKSPHSPQLSSFFYQQPKIWEVRVGERRRGIMLSIQSKNWIKTCFFSWFFPDVLTGWTLLPKSSFINQRLGWWNSVGDVDPCMFHNYHSSYYQPKIREVGENHNLFNASSSTASPKMKIYHQNSESHILFNESPTMLHNYHSSSINQRFGR